MTASPFDDGYAFSMTSVASLALDMTGYALIMTTSGPLV